MAAISLLWVTSLYFRSAWVISAHATSKPKASTTDGIYPARGTDHPCHRVQFIANDTWRLKFVDNKTLYCHFVDNQTLYCHSVNHKQVNTPNAPCGEFYATIALSCLLFIGVVAVSVAIFWYRNKGIINRMLEDGALTSSEESIASRKPGASLDWSDESEAVEEVYYCEGHRRSTHSYINFSRDLECNSSCCPYCESSRKKAVKSPASESMLNQDSIGAPDGQLAKQSVMYNDYKIDESPGIDLSVTDHGAFPRTGCKRKRSKRNSGHRRRKSTGKRCGGHDLTLSRIPAIPPPRWLLDQIKDIDRRAGRGSVDGPRERDSCQVAVLQIPRKEIPSPAGSLEDLVEGGYSDMRLYDVAGTVLKGSLPRSASAGRSSKSTLKKRCANWACSQESLEYPLYFDMKSGKIIIVNVQGNQNLTGPRGKASEKDRGLREHLPVKGQGARRSNFQCSDSD